MIGVLDYGVGNVGAFLRIFHSQNIPAIRVNSSTSFQQVDKMILPGVGAFDPAIGKLNSSGLRDLLDNFVLNLELPLLGVCIGMHMLGNSSEEGVEKGLSYIDGVTEKLSGESLKQNYFLPHMGWNDIRVDTCDPIWDGIDLDQGFYFLHSYCFSPAYSDSCIGVSDYHGEFVCAVKSKNVYGFQFHPEKSLANGIRLLTNFASTM
jgi:glutamine amidotransferase|tara:strand:- start:194 stop:811 length:618 start_codon:yes stop_codon:yes gene_type:complete